MNNIDEIIWQAFIKDNVFIKESSMYNDKAKQLFFKYKNNEDSAYMHYYRENISIIRKQKLNNLKNV